MLGHSEYDPMRDSMSGESVGMTGNGHVCEGWSTNAPDHKIAQGGNSSGEPDLAFTFGHGVFDMYGRPIHSHGSCDLAIGDSSSPSHNSCIAEACSPSPSKPQSERQHHDMSLVCFRPCTDGFIIASDTRRTVVTHGNTLFYDDEKKIFPIPNTNIVAAAIGTNRFGKADTPIGDIILSCADPDVLVMAENLKQSLRQYHGAWNAIVAFASYHGGKPHILSTRQNSDGLYTLSSIFNEPSQTYAIGKEWAVNVAIETDTGPLNVAAGMDSMERFFKAIFAMVDEFKYESQTIGGHMDSYILWPDN